MFKYVYKIDSENILFFLYKNMTSLNFTVGQIHEGGFLNNIYKKGFTNDKCISELVANSLDADSNNIIFKITQNSIKIIDDGKGMNKDGIVAMFNIYKNNHNNDHSMGVSGLGAKAAMLILSKSKNNKPTCVHVYTKYNDDYLCCTIPWNLIEEKGQYTGMIKVRPMESAEISEFKSDRIHNIQGTTIKFEYIDNLKNIIEQQFSNDPHLLNPENKLSIIFGKTNTNILYNHYENPSENIPLKKYNYFKDENNKYYKGKSDYIINHYRDKENGNDRFIWTNSNNNIEYEFPVVNLKTNATSTKIFEVKKSYEHCEYIGQFTVTCGMRIDNNIFDNDNPKFPKNNNSNTEYDLDFFGKDIHDFLGKVPIIRNGQFIGTITLPGLKLSSARGNVISHLKVFRTRTELKYDPISTQKNKQDVTIGIQENKNQYNGSHLPKSFTRLIEHLRNLKFEEINNYFNTRINANKTKNNTKNKTDLINLMNIELVNGQDDNLEIVNGPDDNLEIVNGQDDNLEIVNGPDDNLGKINENTENDSDNENTENDSDNENTENDSGNETNESIQSPGDIHCDIKSSVKGKELCSELMRVKTKLNAETTYTDKNLIHLFNTLTNIFK